MLRRVIALSALGVALAAGAAQAGPERVPLPAYSGPDYVRFLVVDRPDAKATRHMYVNKSALDAARAGQPAPNGASIVMEVRTVELDAAGSPRKDADGRFIATAQITGLFVMQKGAGWGAAYPADKRNGDWDYAQYLPDTKQLRPNTNYEGCFTCHLRRAERDFTFTFTKFVLDGKKMEAR